MTIDLSQFHQIFFEESFENLDIMENALMALNIEHVDSETINAIFRAAHSIKGGSATFGFSAIAGFTHILETLLDQIRSGERGVSKDDVNLFLKSVDAIREMLALLKEGEDAPTDMSRDLAEKFSQILDQKTVSKKAETSNAVDNKSPAKSRPKRAAKKNPLIEEINFWKITFRPGPNLIKTGNDPLRFIRELATLGDLHCVTHLDKVPDLSKLDAELCYFYWDIELQSDCPCDRIQQIFEWVVEESDIVIERAQSAGKSKDDNEGQGETFWSIEFVPDRNIFRTGNDPLKIFEALSSIGSVRSIQVSSHIPGFDVFDPELCYLRWTILLSAGDDDKKNIEELFEWVADESELTIKSVSGLYHSAESELLEQACSDEQYGEPQENNLAVHRQVCKDSAVVFHQTNTLLPGSISSDKKNQQAKKNPVESEAKNATPKAAVATESSTIRVGIDKVDNLINMVGELVITQSMLGQLGTHFDISRLPSLLEGLSQLEQNTRELQESVMRIRMLPISFVFSRFPRMVRDLGQSLNKEVDLKIIGDQTELDKTVLEKIGDPLVHLVRNAVDHGIELPEERIKAGKSKHGTVTLNAYHQGGNVVIEVSDDGKGLDPHVLKQKAVEKGLLTAAEAELLTLEHTYDLIFRPGFSTATEISDVSGRGVGMDVVKSNILSLNGVVDIQSGMGKGSVITVRLPLTLAILDGQLLRVSEQTYIFPIVNIVESMQCKAEFVNRLAGGCNVFRLRDEYVPIIQLAKVFNIPHDDSELEGSLMVVVEAEGEKVGIIVDELLAQQQVVIKSLEQNYQRVQGVSGATILGDGTVSLIVDIPGLVRLAGEGSRSVFNRSNSSHSLAKAFEI